MLIGSGETKEMKLRITLKIGVETEYFKFSGHLAEILIASGFILLLTDTGSIGYSYTSYSDIV